MLVAASGCGSRGRPAAPSPHVASTATVARAKTRPRQAPDVYRDDRPNMLSRTARTALSRVYVPNSTSNTVDVIDPRSYRVVARIPTGAEPQHVTPSYDLRTLWVDSDLGNSLTPIDPRSGRLGRRVSVADPYNLYFTPGGRYAIVVAERLRRLDFRDARTMRLHRSLPVPCPGVDHMDLTATGR
jgi:YVTN family beta-propeller protein